LPSTNAAAVSNPTQTFPLEDQAPPGEDWIKITLKNVDLRVRCGLHPWERHAERPNRILVSVDMYAALPAGGFRGGRARIIDYDAVRDGLLQWQGREHVDLLETLVEDAIDLCFRDPQVRACRVAIRKPDIFSETEEAGVEMFRRRPTAAA